MVHCILRSKKCENYQREFIHLPLTLAKMSSKFKGFLFCSLFSKTKNLKGLITFGVLLSFWGQFWNSGAFFQCLIDIFARWSVLLTILLIFFTLAYFHRVYSYWEDLGVPCSRPFPIVGHTLRRLGITMHILEVRIFFAIYIF